MEFTDRAGVLFEGERRRLATHASLGWSNLDAAPLHVISEVLNNCNGYFQRNPYRRWFDTLEPIVAACGASYYDGTACHLDLVQWATNPIWGKLNSYVHDRLIAEDSAFLASQLQNERMRLLLVNGNSVWTQLQEAAQTELTIERKETLSGLYRQRTCL
jgi:hypothetical protein